ncbi:MAG: hypothetical protein EAY75_06760 [Bacteroidetes bacterium]|nr:MAG: hypothetical protein EAY75_06760 [Bacteroidota bacterium]
MTSKYMTWAFAAATIALSAVCTNLQAQAFTDNTQDAAPSLPVKLLSFSGKRLASNVALSWVTANEQNNRHFNIERSGDGTSFKTIGTVAGRGNSTTTVAYDYTDAQVPTGNLFYRLQQVDFDGKSTYSQIILINNTAAQTASLAVTPNPVRSNVFTVKFDNIPVGIYAISIVGVNGANIYHRMHNHRFATEVVQFYMDKKPPTGVYVLSASNGTERIWQKLVID